jgi:hypothetical protein
MPMSIAVRASFLVAMPVSFLSNDFDRLTQRGSAGQSDIPICPIGARNPR